MRHLRELSVLGVLLTAVGCGSDASPFVDVQKLEADRLFAVVGDKSKSTLRCLVLRGCEGCSVLEVDFTRVQKEYAFADLILIEPSPSIFETLSKAGISADNNKIHPLNGPGSISLIKYAPALILINRKGAVQVEVNYAK